MAYENANLSTHSFPLNSFNAVLITTAVTANLVFLVDWKQTLFTQSLSSFDMHSFSKQMYMNLRNTTGAVHIIYTQNFEY